MDEKRKPYATIMIRKPRVSLLLSAVLVAAIVAVAASGILQERADRAAELETLQESLETTQNLVMRAETERGRDRRQAAVSRKPACGLSEAVCGTGWLLRLFGWQRQVAAALFVQPHRIG